jgi:hypothetical protein
MLDYQLAHGTTPMDWKWPGIPFATSCGGDKEYGRCFQDVPVDYVGGIETDKVSELGLGYIRVYEMTGERKYPAMRQGDGGTCSPRRRSSQSLALQGRRAHWERH